MAKTSQVIQEQVRTIYYSNGRNLSDAARTVGVPIDRAEKWKERQAWDNVITKREMSELSEASRRTADNVANELATLERETRISLAKSAANMANQAQSVDIKQSSDVHNVAKTAAIVHKWGERETAGANVVVNVALLGIDPATVSATSEHSKVLDAET